MTEKKQPKEEANDTGLVSKMLKWAAYPVAVVAGLWTAKVNISDAAYERLKAKGGFDDLYHGQNGNGTTPHHTSTIAQQPLHTNIDSGVDALHKQEVKSAILNINAGNAHLNQDFPARISQQDGRYHPLVDQRMKDMGLGDIRNQIKYTHRSHHQTAFLNGMTVAAIAVGALLTMAESKAISHLLAKKDKEKEAETGRSA